MASTISYAKVVRNRTDDENCPTDNVNIPDTKVNLSKEQVSSIITEIDDPSFKEVSAIKKVSKYTLFV